MTDINRLSKDFINLFKDPDEFVGTCSGMSNNDGTVNVIRPDGGSINAVLANTGRGSKVLCQRISGKWYAWREGETNIISEQTVLQRRSATIVKEKIPAPSLQILFSKQIATNHHAFYVGGYIATPIKIWESSYFPSIRSSVRGALLSNQGERKWLVSIVASTEQLVDTELDPNEPPNFQYSSRLVIVKRETTKEYAPDFKRLDGGRFFHICGHGFVYFEGENNTTTAQLPIYWKRGYVYKDQYDIGDMTEKIYFIDTNDNNKIYYSNLPNEWFYLPGLIEDNPLLNVSEYDTTAKGQMTTIVDKAVKKSMYGWKEVSINKNFIRIKTITGETFVFENFPLIIHRLANTAPTTNNNIYQATATVNPNFFIGIDNIGLVANWIDDYIYIVDLGKTTKVDGTNSPIFTGPSAVFPEINIFNFSSTVRVTLNDSEYIIPVLIYKIDYTALTITYVETIQHTIKGLGNDPILIHSASYHP